MILKFPASCNDHYIFRISLRLMAPQNMLFGGLWNPLTFWAHNSEAISEDWTLALALHSWRAPSTRWLSRDRSAVHQGEAFLILTSGGFNEVSGPSVMWDDGPLGRMVDNWSGLIVFNSLFYGRCQDLITKSPNKPLAEQRSLDTCVKAAPALGVQPEVRYCTVITRR